MEAIEKYDTAISLSNLHLASHYNKATALFTMASLEAEGYEPSRIALEAARQALNQALSIKPDHLFSLGLQPKVLQRMATIKTDDVAINLLNEACVCLEKLISLEKRNVGTWDRLLECLLAKADRTSSQEDKETVLRATLEAADKALHVHPGNSGIVKIKAVALKKLEELASAPLPKVEVSSAS